MLKDAPWDPGLLVLGSQLLTWDAGAGTLVVVSLSTLVAWDAGVGTLAVSLSTLLAWDADAGPWLLSSAPWEPGMLVLGPWLLASTWSLVWSPLALHDPDSFWSWDTQLAFQTQLVGSLETIRGHRAVPSAWAKAFISHFPQSQVHILVPRNVEQQPIPRVQGHQQLQASIRVDSSICICRMTGPISS